MSKAGDTIENPITGERIVVRVGTEDSGSDLLAIDDYVRPGGGRCRGARPPGHRRDLRGGQRPSGLPHRRARVGRAAGERLRVPAGTAHDWWNAGEEEARVPLEIRPGERFEQMALNLVGLAQDGKTNAKGMPNLLQAAIFAREFADVLYFTRPTFAVQRLLFGALGAIARALGYRGSYPKYTDASGPALSNARGASPPSAARVALGTSAVTAPLMLTSLLLFESHASPRSPGR